MADKVDQVAPSLEDLGMAPMSTQYTQVVEEVEVMVELEEAQLR